MSRFSDTKPTLLLDALYCSDEHLEDEEESSFCSNAEIHHTPFPILLEQPLILIAEEEDELSSLFSKEKQNFPRLEAGSGPPDQDDDPTRFESVQWMLKVTAHYSFSALTAVLAVNYFDRFISSSDSQREKPWMTQLAAVACLSLAAKVEEVQVPLLLDLQVEDSRYVFEAATIQRMEVLVLSTLHWRMHPVTPLSFLDHITKRLGLKDYLSLEFIGRFEQTLLSVISVSRFVNYLPSTIAAATMLHVVSSVAPSIAQAHQNQLLGILRTDKDKADECWKLMTELLPSGDGSQSHKRKFSSVPGSPNGVIDVSFSFDSSNESWTESLSLTPSSSVSSSPQPLSKRSKAQSDECC